jgi:DNA topoisomerase-6 subunit A
LKNSPKAKKEEIKKLLKEIGEEAYKDLDNASFPELSFPSRSVSNIVYDPKIKQYVLGPAMVTRSASNIKHIRPYTQLLWLADFANKLVDESKTSTLRDVYYSSQAYNVDFVDQAESDEIITDLEATLGRPRENFQVYPEERSAIFGDLTIEYTSRGYEGRRVNLSSIPDGVLIGPGLSTAELVETSAEMVIAVEKGGIFTRFVEEKVHERYNAIVIDTAGQPPRSTRYMLRRLNQELNLPVYIMSDGDVYGEHIAMVIISGSAGAAHLRELAVPTAKWLGVWASVTGDEPVIVEKNGLLRNMEIAKLYEDTKKVGDVPLSYFALGTLTALCCSDHGEIGLKPVNAIIRHNYKGDIYKIRTIGGYSVKTTGNHSIQKFDARSCKLVSSPVSSLEVGDLVASCFSIPNFERLSEINLAKLIAQETPELAENVYVEGMDSKEFSDYLWNRYSKRILREIFYQVLKRKEKGVKLSYFLAEGRIPSKGTLRLRYSQHRIPISINDIERFARLMGYHAGKGGFSKGAHGSVCELSFGGTETRYVEDACDCIRESFFLEPKIRYLRGSDAIRITYGNSLLAKIYYDVLGTGRHAELKQIPFIFFNVSNKAKKEFLKGYFSGDRTIDYSGIHRLGAKTVSRKLASDLVVLLRQLGVTAYVWKSGPSFLVTCADTSGIQDMVDEIFRKEVGIKSTTFNLPAELIQNAKEALVKQAGYGYESTSRATILAGGPTHNVGYGRFGQALTKFKIQSNDELLQSVDVFIRNKVALLPVTEITNLGKTNEPVYDLEVDGVHTFIGGSGGLVLHNSDVIRYKLPTDPMTEADIKRAQELKKDPRYHGGIWQRELDTFLKIKRKSELEAFAKYSLTYIVDKYLKDKMEEAKSM